MKSASTNKDTATDRGAAARGRRGLVLLWGASGLAIVLALGGLLVLAMTHRVTGVSPTTGAPAEPGINSNSAALLQLDSLPGPHEDAPDFALTDQNGTPVSLSQYRGKAVVLSFNDDRCEDLCTLLAQDVAAADHDLGAAASQVVFLSINANPFHPTPADVKDWTDSHGLADDPNWVFATGTPGQLKDTAAKYGVPVSADPKTQEVVHGSELFFIDPAGKEAAMGQFGTESANTAPFAHAMAQMAVDLLSQAAGIAVGGPQLDAGPPSGSSSAELNAPAPDFSLALLNDASATLSLGSTRGKYTVVNFWAGTCSACVQELPAMESAHRQLGSGVAFLGVDVADPDQAGEALASKSGITYPLLTDAKGAAAGAYRIPGLPFTAIIGPGGKLLVRHAGAVTDKQLTYIISTLEQTPS
ncbi:redoxin domain-containing protein [Paeniglutamicibacter antarcticus]|uniref:Redoxin domain-containing protein n=1 Tax=Arthrobacter terrae TaxID=2935737 RepID=A0A931G444_9MICC|nr:redoxin domain-containing protein [Arthrobacter terrae]MBG0737995.1 redoxin domain-containing protein [Arthrobacter terrae]